jgi:hypothetical protein
MKSKSKASSSSPLLKGWAAIASYLAIPVATAHRWAKDGMPVRREGRFTVADPTELSAWLGRESHMPAAAHVVTGETDLAAALSESISVARSNKRKKSSKAD